MRQICFGGDSLKRAILLIVVSCLFASIFVFAAAEQGKDNDKGPLEKITFIHYKKGFAKPSAPGKTKPVNCYGYLASGAKWKINEPYLINPTNGDGLGASFVESAVNAGVAEWERFGGNIFGGWAIDYSAQYVDNATDEKNTVTFGTIDDSGIIAVTNVWGYFSGSPKTRQLVEWDMLFNDAYFAFGDATLNSALMDLQNIATHELGHSAGMDDLYNTVCFQETMYGYSTEGETSKRDLYSGDIAGITKLYGS